MQTPLGVWRVNLDSTWTYRKSKGTTDRISKRGTTTNTRHRIKIGAYQNIFNLKRKEETVITNPNPIITTTKPSGIYVRGEICHRNIGQQEVIIWKEKLQTGETKEGNNRELGIKIDTPGETIFLITDGVQETRQDITGGQSRLHIKSYTEEKGGLHAIQVNSSCCDQSPPPTLHIQPSY